MALAMSLSCGALSLSSIASISSTGLSSQTNVDQTWKRSESLQSPSFRLRAQAPEETSSSSTVVVPSEEKRAEFPPGSCAACGKPEKVGGCNGEGRIQGGIGAVPGFGWWPIKAFRPCPAFVEAGGKYKRIGQSLDEVAFGRASAGDDLDISERLKGR